MLAAAALTLGACASTHYVTIRHPLQVGQVDPNEVPFEARRAETAQGLQRGTLVDTATLTEVTPDRICARTNLWSIDELDGGRGVYQNYRITLRNDVEDVENTDAQIQLEQPTMTPAQGHIAERVHAGWRRVCASTRNGHCVRYNRVEVHRTIYVPHVWNVSNNGATICFPNGGFITPATTRVALSVDGQGPGEMIFEWQFESAVQGGQPQQQ